MIADLWGPAALGGVAAFGLAPWHLYPATIAALIGLFVVWRDVRIGRAAWRGFVFGLAFLGIGLGGLFAALRDHGASMPLAVLATALLIVYMAVYPALAGALAGATNRIARPLWALLVVPAAWALSELLRGWVYAGLPGLSLGYVASAAPFSGLAPLAGVHGLGLALMIAAGTVWLLYFGTLLARFVALVLVAILPLAVWIVPPPAHWTRALHHPLSVAVLQADVRRATSAGEALRRYCDMTTHSNADLVVWPELRLATDLGQARPFLDTLNNAAAQRDRTILAGLLWPVGSGGFAHRVLTLGAGRSGADGAQAPVRQRSLAGVLPVPGGLVAVLDGLGAPLEPSTTGVPPVSRVRSHGTTLSVTSGSMDRPGHDARRALSAAGILVDLSSEGGDNAAARARHLDIARMRALQTGRPLARATHAGISAVIGYDGRLLYTAPVDEPARLVARLRPRVGATPYTIDGDAPLGWASVTVVLLGLIGAALLGWRDSGRCPRARMPHE